MRQRRIYAAIREAHAEKGYPIELACELLHVSRSAYHKWASGKLSRRAAENDILRIRLRRSMRKAQTRAKLYVHDGRRF